MLASDLGGVEERLPADLETCRSRGQSRALLSAAVGGSISQGGRDWSLVSF